MEECKKSAGLPFIPSSGINTIEVSPTEQIYECKICNNCYSSPIQLTTHYVTCHRLLPCQKCLLLFLNRADLDEHYKVKHANDETNCSQCALTFPSSRPLVDHLYETHQKKYCQLCSALVKSSASSTLQRHIEHVHKIPSRIKSNDPIFSFDNLAANGTFDCLICHQSFESHRLFTHSLSFHKLSLGFIFANILEKRFTSPLLKTVENSEKLSDFDEKTLCGICKFKFTPLAPKVIHQIYCHGLNVCRACFAQFDGDENFNAHVSSCDLVRNADSNYCKFCGEDATDDQDHLSRVHCIDQAICSDKISHLYSVEQTSWISTNFACNFCKEDLTSIISNVENLVKHFMQRHMFSPNSIFGLLQKSLVNLERDGTNDTKRRAIPFQEVELITKESGEGGMIFDFDSKMVRVVYSSATDSDSSGNEERDEARTHRPVYVCLFCAFKTAVKSMFATHLNQKHGFTSKIEENLCNACKRIFSTPVNLQRHFRNVHHKKNANHYECPFCPTSIRGKQKMRNHFKSHVESSYHPCLSKEIGYNCRYCHHSFWVAEKLNEHVFNRHSDKFEQSFLMCSICAATFINKTCLRQHSDLKHPNAVKFTSFLYQCKICCTAHVDIHGIRAHMTETHPSIRSSYCAEPQCRQYVNDAESFQAHYSRFHGRKIFKCTECPKLFETKLYAAKHFEASHTPAKRLKRD